MGKSLALTIMYVINIVDFTFTQTSWTLIRQLVPSATKIANGEQQSAVELLPFARSSLLIQVKYRYCKFTLGVIGLI